MTDTSAAPREIELKLLTTEDGLRAVAASPVLGAYADGPARTSQLRSDYFDTGEFDLLRRGATLRVRQSGDGYVQTVKRSDDGKGPGAATSREEWEWDIPGPDPDTSLLPPGLLRDLLPIGARLEPVFRTEIERVALPLRLEDGSRIELALDRGRILSGHAAEPVAEVELELKDGDPAAIYALALRLMPDAPLRIGIESKSAVGYRLRGARHPVRSKPLPSVLSPALSAETGFSLLAGLCLAQLLDNLAAAERGDPTVIHQSRVAFRRLRVLLALFRAVGRSPGARSLNAEARWLARMMGAVRDWDVFLSQTLSQVAPENDEPVERLRRAAERQRSVEQAALSAALASPRSAVFLLRLSQWLATHGWRDELGGGERNRLARPLGRAAPRLLARMARRVSTRAAALDRMNDEQRHDLRKAAKALRYAVEFLLPVLPETQARRYLDRLKALQDALGRMNDVAVAQALLGRLPESSELALAKSRLQARLHSPSEEGERQVLKAWQRFGRETPPWSGTEAASR